MGAGGGGGGGLQGEGDDEDVPRVRSVPSTKVGVRGAGGGGSISNGGGGGGGGGGGLAVNAAAGDERKAGSAKVASTPRSNGLQQPRLTPHRTPAGKGAAVGETPVPVVDASVTDPPSPDLSKIKSKVANVRMNSVKKSAQKPAARAAAPQVCVCVRVCVCVYVCVIKRSKITSQVSVFFIVPFFF